MTIRLNHLKEFYPKTKNISYLVMMAGLSINHFVFWPNSTKTSFPQNSTFHTDTFGWIVFSVVLFLFVPLVIFLVIWFSIFSVLWIWSTVPARLFCVFFFCQDLSKFCFFFPFYLLSFTVNQINFGKEPFLNVTWPDKLQFVPDAHSALKVCAQFQPFSKPIWQHGSCIHLAMSTKHPQ